MGTQNIGDQDGKSKERKDSSRLSPPKGLYETAGGGDQAQVTVENALIDSKKRG